MTDFEDFPKIARLSREVVITEKLDGTNAQIYLYPSVDGSLNMKVGSRNRWLALDDDNYGFANWAHANQEELLKLGEGRHFGEWWGKGIQRNYSMTRKCFSLFNTHRWSSPSVRPACCDIVPVLYEGPFEQYGVLQGVKSSLAQLLLHGSVASPGFMNPEGIVIYHKASNKLYKKTIEKDEEPKGKKNA